MKHILDWEKYLDTAAQAVAEGIVLLKNEKGALPLQKEEEISVFGRIQLNYYKSGTGSGGMVNVSKVTGILDGLLEAGVSVNEELLEIYKNWSKENPYDLGNGWGGEPWSQKEMPLTDELVEKAAKRSKTALVIIGRTAGEDQDNRNEEGSFLLTSAEKEMLRLTRRYFEKMVVVLNVGNIIDMSFEDEFSPDAIAYVWQGGMTGGTGTAMVLTGEVSPSGKLTDTIAYHVEDYPSHKNFGGEKSDRYAEDIYVGYRYFETFAKEKVRYPFGFGLSYTNFDISVEKTESGEGEHEAVLFAKVTNTGDRPGKEVVQVYCEAPQGKLGKPARVLTAFAKTKTLAPGESETLQISVAPQASYDDSGVSGFRFHEVLEAGEYRFYVGSDVRLAQCAYTMEIPETVSVSAHTQALAPVEGFQRLRPEASGDGYVEKWEEVPVSGVDEEARRQNHLPEELSRSGEYADFLEVYRGNVQLKDFVAGLSDEELFGIVRGEGMGSPRVTAGTAAAFGGVTDTLAGKKIPAACCADGPSGMRLDCGTKAFSLPNGTLLAATFNCELLETLFYSVGMEMVVNKVDCLLGPGLNIHRHPLNGRNFEYFSEDPLVTGKMAVAELKGLHKAGVTGTIKHCCANNQETNRHFFNSIASERALREIYLRGFEMAVKEGGAQTIMTTYGAVNGVWTAGNYDICTEILRNDWGFDGVIMTDWWANVNRRGEEPAKNDLASMVRAQNDVYMVCADTLHNEDNLKASLEDGSLTRGELQRCAYNTLNFLLKTHAMKRLAEEADEVETIHRPADEMDDGKPVVFYDLGKELTVPLTEVSAEKGTSYSFGLTVNELGFFSYTITASADGGELAQIPMTLFSMGTASGTFTWNGTDGKLVSFTGEMPLFSKFTTIRLYFAQNGLHLDNIRFEKKADF